jgi:hypothetical protein
MRTAICILSMWLMYLGSDSTKADEMPHFKITTKRENDRVDFKVDQGGALFAIRSPVGLSGNVFYS